MGTMDKITGIFSSGTALKVGKINESLPMEYLHEVLCYEGGYVNDPADKGGETNMGITAAALASAQSAGLIPKNVTVKTLTKEHARIIYERNYYKAGKADRLQHPLAFAHFDACVNHGLKGGGRLLQKALNRYGYSVVVDGIVGPKTLVTAEEAQAYYGPVALTESYCIAREALYYAIVAKNPTQKKFLKGWLNRLARVKKFCGISV